MNKKKYFACLFFVIILGLFGCSASNERDIVVPTVKADTYVYDSGDILSDEIEVKTNELLDQLEEQTQAEVVVITVPDLNGFTIEDYANQLFNTLGIGKSNKDNGVLLLIARDDSRVRLEIGRGFEGVLTDSISGMVLDEYFVPYRDSNDYNTAVKLTSQAVCKLIAEEYGISIAGLSNEITISNEETNDDGVFGIAFFVFVIFILVIVLISVCFDDSDGFGTGSGLGGGYFGGSSGGCSSFGGGFSGGGGASR